jgi:HemY protein
MIRMLRYLILLALLSFGAVWVADHPGQISIDWEGWRIDSSVAVIAALVVAIAIALTVLYELYRWLMVSPRKLAERRGERRRQRGYRALTRGLVSAAAGDPSGAHKAARDAEALLGEPPLTLLLTAQAAQLEGDQKRASAAFREMLTHEETEFLGLRGLLVQAMRKGDRATARELARRAFEINPDAGWVLSNLIELESAEGNWNGAEQAVANAVRTRRLTQVEGRRKQALFGYQRATAMARDGRDREALAEARKALAKQPDFVPAVVLAADLMVRTGREKEARKLIARAWATTPHPDLAAKYADAVAATNVLDKVQALEPLIKARPEARDGHLAIAEAALEAELWGKARHHLDAIDEPATARHCRLRARLEEAEHGDAAAARDWWRRASIAPPDPAWVCGECGTPTPDWHLQCESCRAVDSMTWRAPPTAAAEAVGPGKALEKRVTTVDQERIT